MRTNLAPLSTPQPDHLETSGFRHYVKEGLIVTDDRQDVYATTLFIENTQWVRNTAQRRSPTQRGRWADTNADGVVTQGPRWATGAGAVIQW